MRRRFTDMTDRFDRPKLTAGKCNHIVAIQVNQDGSMREVTESEYRDGEYAHTFQDELIDVCPKCKGEIDWWGLHNSMGI